MAWRSPRSRSCSSACSRSRTGRSSGCCSRRASPSCRLRPCACGTRDPSGSTSTGGSIRMTRRISREVPMRFKDRSEAGRLLGERPRDEHIEDPVVLGLPRGGVVVAAEVAAALGAPLDVLVARKLGVPWQPELAFGAVAPGVVALRDDVVAAAGLRGPVIDEAAARESAKLVELAARYRGDSAAVNVRGRTTVIVVHGLATGATATAPPRPVRREWPQRSLLAGRASP